MPVSQEECKRYTHPSGGWLSGSQLQRQLRNICHGCGWPAIPTWIRCCEHCYFGTPTPRSFSLKPSLSSWPVCCQIPGSRCRRLVGGWFFKKTKTSKKFLTHIMVICCTIHWVVKNLHCHHGNCNSITYCQGVLSSFLALL